MKEIWKPIHEYETYVISNLGQVKNTKFNRVIFGTRDSVGYLTFTFRKNGKSIKKRRHRLLAQAFLKNPNNFPEVNHINGIKSDDNLSNLEWCDGKHNIQHAFKLGLNKGHKGENSGKSRFTNKDIIKIRQLREEGFTYNKLAKTFNSSSGYMYHIIKRKYWSHI